MSKGKQRLILDLNFGLTCLKKSSMYITHWSPKYADCEKSAKGSSARRRPWETQLQYNEIVFSVGCPTRGARGGSAYMKQNASFSVGMEHQWQPNKAAFSVGSNRDKE